MRCLKILQQLRNTGCTSNLRRCRLLQCLGIFNSLNGLSALHIF